MGKYLDPTGTKLWEIQRDGATIVQRSGKVGTKGRATRKTYANALVARFEYANLVDHKTQTENYRGLEPRRAPDDFPFDDDARLVHADVLQQRGDPLGELIVQQHRGLDTSDLVEQHAARWFGDLVDLRDCFDFEWRLGRLHAAMLVRDLHFVEDALDDIPKRFMLGIVLAALFDLEIARSLDELVVGSVGTTDYEHTMTTIVESASPTLRRLEIDPERRPRPEGFLAPMQFAALEEFACDLNLSTSALEHVANAQWPKLRRLAFSIAGSDDEDVPTEPSLVELAPLLAGKGVPALRELEIWTPAPAALCRTLLAAPIVPQLEELVIKSRRVCEPSAIAALEAKNPNARYLQMPLYSMRPY